MCVDPVTGAFSLAATAAAISAATAVGGTLYSASESQAATDAQRRSNQVTLDAQNAGFWSRNQDARTRLAAEGTAQTTAQGKQQQAFGETQDAQRDAFGDRARTIDAENTSADAIRQEADQQQQSLIDHTNAQRLTQSQADKEAQINAGVAPVAANIETASPLGGGGDSSGTKQAYAARLASAAGNVRDYGKRLATVASYTAPLTTVGTEIANEKAGIMPAAMANQLLQSGQQIRLLPSETAYRAAGTQGAAKQGSIAAALQGDLGVAKTQYEGGVDTANLQQAGAKTLAENAAIAAKEKATQAKSIGDVISGVGSIGAYASGRYSDYLNGLGGGSSAALIKSMGGVNPQFGAIT